MKKRNKITKYYFLDCNNSTLIRDLRKPDMKYQWSDADSVENEIEAERVKLAYLRKMQIT